MLVCVGVSKKQMSLKGERQIDDQGHRLSGRETRGREEGIEVCPVTIAQPRSNSEELLAVRIYAQGGGNN